MGSSDIGGLFYEKWNEKAVWSSVNIHYRQRRRSVEGYHNDKVVENEMPNSLKSRKIKVLTWNDLENSRSGRCIHKCEAFEEGSSIIDHFNELCLWNRCSIESTTRRMGIDSWELSYRNNFPFPSHKLQYFAHGTVHNESTTSYL